MKPGERMKYILVYLLLINMAAFFLMGWDKRLARNNRRRVPERTLFLPVLLGGGPGGWLGMYSFHHKTRHWKFVLGFPAVVILEYGLLLWYFMGKI